MELTLHVGLKKTATSTLQATLHLAKPQLAARGLLVPGSPDAHHRLARRLRDGAGVAQALRPILDDIAETGPDRVLVSSEHLVSLPGPAVEALRGRLERHLPEARVRVLAYVREPVAFATSMAQQNVKNGVIRLAEAYAAPWRFPIAEWLETYIRVFGREAVVVRRFDQDAMVGGHIVGDVLATVGIADGLPGVEVPRRNLSLSLEGVMVADALAGLRPGDSRRKYGKNLYRRPLSRIAGSRFVLPADVQERVIADSAADMAWLNAEFGLDIRPRRVTDHPVPTITEAMALARAQAIVAAVEA
jgi:hypothetical protein